MCVLMLPIEDDDGEPPFEPTDAAIYKGAAFGLFDVVLTFEGPCIAVTAEGMQKLRELEPRLFN